MQNRAGTVARAARAAFARAVPRRALLLAPLLVPLPLGGCAAAPGAAAASALPTVAARTRGLVSVPGLLPLHWDAAGARLLLEPAPDGAPLLWFVGLRTGLGSNDVGLDRGQLGERRLVEFRTVGRRVLLVAPNQEYRSSAADPAERRGVEESFAFGVVAAFDVVAESDGRRLVDATDFFLADRHFIAAKLRAAGQGEFALDPARSVLLADELRGFPDNTEVEALLTFAGERPGPEVEATAADPRSPGFRVHHSFVRLEPEPTFRPRAFHPRSGYFPLVYRDAAAAIDEPLERRLIHRHRLERDAAGHVREPIVYYVDRAAPEPVRTALLEGAGYWAPVFERAGFPGGFRVELLPAGVDPLDVRYDVIQWVDRSTRGWSYGDSVADPRTGEILKGHVTLGALRVRQDVLLAEGLLSPYGADGEPDPRVRRAALARIRQLAAHEVGHTLGLAHDFAASVDGRASVMDYPAPRVTIEADGTLDLSDAYRDGCGEWDELAIRYGYGQWEDEAAGLAATLEAMAGLHFLTDADARGDDRSHPLANLWDDGSDPLAEFEHTAAVRAAALAAFSERALRPGRALAELEEVFLPVYFHHRFQLEAVAKTLGGVDYAYALRGEAGVPAEARPVPGERQARALALLLSTLAPEFLDLPARIREHGVPPRPPGYEGGRERLEPGALQLDPLAAVAASADRTLELLLQPSRATRVLDQGRLDAAQPGLEGLLDALLAATWSEDGGTGPDRRAAIRDEVRVLVVEHLLALAADPRAPVRVRAPVRARLVELRERLAAAADDAAGDVPRDVIALWAADRIAHFLDDPRVERGFDEEHELPPGAPIGAGAAHRFPLPALGDCAVPPSGPFAPFASSAARGR